MPNRIIKESIAASERIAALSDFQFRLWVGLITFVDDKGRGDARAAMLRGHLFPLREDITTRQVAEALTALAEQGCITLYEVEGKPYFYFPNWDKHQRVRNVREKYPAPPSAASCGELRPESESESESESEAELENESESEAEAEREAEVESEPPAGVCADAPSPRGRYGWVKLTQAQVDQLNADLGEQEAKRCIDHVDESAQSNGNKNHWTDWDLVVRRCHRYGWGLKQGQLTLAVPLPSPAVSAAQTRQDMERMRRILSFTQQEGVAAVG